MCSTIRLGVLKWALFFRPLVLVAVAGGQEALGFSRVDRSGIGAVDAPSRTRRHCSTRVPHFLPCTRKTRVRFSRGLLCGARLGPNWALRFCRSLSLRNACWKVWRANLVHLVSRCLSRSSVFRWPLHLCCLQGRSTADGCFRDSVVLSFPGFCVLSTVLEVALATFDFFDVCGVSRGCGSSTPVPSRMFQEKLQRERQSNPDGDLFRTSRIATSRSAHHQEAFEFLVVFSKRSQTSLRVPTLALTSGCACS